MTLLLDPTEPLRAITMGAEYAALVAAGIKGPETRGQRCNYRGLVCIHAGLFAQGLPKRWRRHEEGGSFILGGRVYVGRSGSGPFIYTTDGRMPHQRLHLGAIVAVANLVDCVPMVGTGVNGWPHDRLIVGMPDLPSRLLLCRGGTEQNIEDQRPYGDYTPGRWALLLEDAHWLPEPVPCRGAQAVPWRVPDDVAARVREQIGAAA